MFDDIDILGPGETGQILSGGTGDDFLSSALADGFNRLYGGADNDVLQGNHHDMLYGGVGNDALIAYYFSQLYGGAGNDQLSGDHHNVLNGGAGDDHIDTTNGSGYNILSGGAGNDLLEGHRFDVLYGSQGNDTLSATDHSELFGGADDDVLSGDSYNQLYGGAGNDELNVASGNGFNRLSGGAGNDLLRGNHHDELIGQAGDDVLNTASGSGDNTLRGGEGNDSLYAGVDDVLLGGAGDDFFSFLRGGNEATGGAGSDHFEIAAFRLPAEANTIFDFEIGEDMLSINSVRGINSFSDLTFTQDGDDAVISFDGHDIAILEGVDIGDLSAEDILITPEVPYDTVIDAADFQDGEGNPFPVDNEYFPRIPGMKLVYEGLDEDGLPEHIEIEILTPEQIAESPLPEGRNIIEGVETTVMRDRVYVDGVLVEDTFDYFAQDSDGNVWYFGEDVVNYNYDEDGNLTGTDSGGSWISGEDGAMAGIYMFADPTAHVGEAYFQEFYAGEAEDAARIIAADLKLDVLGVSYDDVLLTLDYTPIDAGSLEFKYYVKGIGPVKLNHLINETEFRLIEFTPAS